MTGQVPPLGANSDSQAMHPAQYAAAVTPSDSVHLDVITRGIYVGGTGNVTVTTYQGNLVTFVGAQAGSVIPVRAILVMATDTTATSLVALA